MRTIDPSKLSDYVNKKIYKYELMYIEPIMVDSIIGLIQYFRSDCYDISIDANGQITYSRTVTDFPFIGDLILFETIECAKMKQAIDIHFFYNKYHDKKSITPQELLLGPFLSSITISTLEQFVVDATNSQMTYNEYLKIITDVFENYPEYLI